ncbi:MAG: NAD(P)H-dependent oxidoreductase subunit E [Bacteroidales bacterium]|jgi:NADH-quinone oxidoreductase subunit E|nr:NAD(P)H-dependent oxidoreductase subunit E [Bacteroidales bacterium]
MDEIIGIVLSRYPAGKKEGLLPILQEIQEEKGFLTGEILNEVSAYLDIPVNKIYGVAAFYDQFRFKPHGRFHIQLCNGTSCYLHGSFPLLRDLEKQLKIKAGSTSRDGKFSIEIIPCMGACEQSPVIKVNDTSYNKVTQEDLRKIIRTIKDKSE